MIGDKHTDHRGEWIECDWDDAEWLIYERRQRNPWKTYGVMIPVKRAAGVANL